VAWGSSQPHVEAWGSSQPHVEAWASSQPHVVAWGYAQLSLFGKILATATANVAVLIRGKGPKVKGGKQTKFEIKTPAQWCDYYGVEVKKGIAVLYKAVDDDFSTSRARPVGIFYAPGNVPVAPDWDGGKQECGKGLHFSPAPVMGLEFNTGARRFVACPVKLSDLSVHPEGEYPHKVKAKGCCAPVWEVNRRGEKIEKSAAPAEVLP
jgi:hypothetical protein